jgi:hypothetical protein
MGSDLTTMAWIYKRKYTDPRVADIVMRDHPRFAKTPKKPGFTGESVTYSILTGNPQGISGTFTDAQDGAESSKGEKLIVTRKPKFAVVKLTAEAVAASEGNDAAFYDLVTRETTGKLSAMGEDFAFDLYRSGNGMRGRRASISSNTITLTVADDARNFFRGQTLIADDTITGASPKAGSAKVTGIDLSGGKITVDNAAGISGFADNDYLFRKGDPGTCMDGLEVLTPLTAPVLGSDSFRGIDRGVDVQRLSGSRVADDGSSLEERMGLGNVYVSQLGKSHVCKDGWLNPIRFWEIVKRQNAKVQFTSGGGTAKYGFQYIEIITPAGVMTLYADPDCPVSRGYGDNPEHDYIHHLKGLPHIAMQGPSNYIMQYNAAGIESRAYSWCNYVQEDPAAHFVVEIV